MMNDPKHNLETVLTEDTEEARQAQFKKDKEALKKYDDETEMLLKQLENIKKID